MRIHLLVLFLSIYQLHGHGPHESHHQLPSSGHPHISRKMEDYVHDMNHIKHDLQGQIDKPLEQMTPQEQNFYYFKLHDTNNDNRLDGLEIIAAFDHVHDEEFAYDETTNANTTDEKNHNATERLPDAELINLIDDILKDEDFDRDGFISYDEFKHALEKDKMN